MKSKINVHSVRVFGNLNRARSAKVPLLIIAIVAVIWFSMIACNKSGGSSGSDSSKSIGGGGKSINNPEALKEYIDSQPANSPNNPIKVSMGVNELMIPKIKEVINSADKYVSLNLTGDALTTIPREAFSNCKMLVGITIPNTVTSIEYYAFANCKDLTNVTIPDSVTNIGDAIFFESPSITSVIIPNSVTKIGIQVFEYCINLTSVTFASGSSITDDNFGFRVSPEGSKGNGGETLKTAYSTGKAGTYTRAANGSTWTKQ